MEGNVPEESAASLFRVDGGNRFLRSTENVLLDYTVSHSRIQ
jgi:hypothetical protein